MIKSYICIRDWVDPGHAINSAAHAGTIIMLEWSNHPEVQEWIKNSIRKVTCVINKKQQKILKLYDDYQIITENAFGGAEVGLVFRPRLEWPKYFKFLALWNPSYYYNYYKF
jgi:hypothetical protein